MGAASRLGYALLVPVLVLVLARLEVAHGAHEPSPAGEKRRGGAGLWLLLATAALFAGLTSGLFTLQIAGFPLAIAGAVAALGGWAALRRHGHSLLLLGCMVPPPTPLFDRVQPLLVESSGQLTRALLLPFDPAVTWAGSTLGFRGWTVIVAEACSGSGTLLILGVLGLFLAGLERLGPARTAALLALVPPVALLVNGVRIATSALCLDAFGPAAATGAAHEWLGLVLVIAAALLLAWILGRRHAGRAPVPARLDA